MMIVYIVSCVKFGYFLVKLFQILNYVLESERKKGKIAV